MLSGILLTSSRNLERVGVKVSFTWVMKFVGARPYWYEGEPRVCHEISYDLTSIVDGGPKD